MYVHETRTRVRYTDTDKMGIMYYGNYAILYEVGRTETMRTIGTSYRKMEESGCIMPVVSMTTKFIKPAYYDDFLLIRTILKELPKSTIRFEYQIFNEENELINMGETVLAFVDTARNKPVRAPNWFVDKLRNYIKS